MKLHSRNLVALVAIFASVFPISMSAAKPGTPRQELAADAGWKFFLGDPNGAEAPLFADGAWRTVRGGCYLDHAWGVRAARALDADPGRATATTGFRIAIDVDKEGV